MPLAKQSRSDMSIIAVRIKMVQNWGQSLKTFWHKFTRAFCKLNHFMIVTKSSKGNDVKFS